LAQYQKLERESLALQPEKQSSFVHMSFSRGADIPQAAKGRAIGIAAKVGCNPVDITKCGYVPLAERQLGNTKIAAEQAANHVGEVRPTMHHFRTKFFNRPS
jgi:hypothetical protein